MTRRIVLVSIAVLAGAVGTMSRGSVAPGRTSASSAADRHSDVTPRAAVDVDIRRQQLIGVRTVMARHDEMLSDLRLAGIVVPDEARQAEINTRLDGWIRELHADYTGRRIRTGEPLFTLSSPDVLAGEREYLLARAGAAAREGGDARLNAYADRLVAAARERLLRLEVPAQEIAHLEATGEARDEFTVTSPVSGVIVEKAAVRGMRVMAGQMLYRVADLSTLWVEAEVYASDLPAVQTGLAAAVTLDAVPGRSFSGSVDYIYPMLTPETRTARMRIALGNPNGTLKPNMLATVTIRARRAMTLVLPVDAVVDTGTDHLVFLAEGDGRFTPRRVRVGRATGGRVEIVEGLTDGDEVAASATFFLDSESQLRGALQNYDPPPQIAASTAGANETVITLRADPELATVGDTSFIVAVGRAEQPVAGARVTVVLSMPPMPSMNMPALKSQAVLAEVTPGVYRGSAQIIAAGGWDVSVRVEKDGQQLALRRFHLTAR
jgi:RND family efflux transporter MFP subunit